MTQNSVSDPNLAKLSPRKFRSLTAYITKYNDTVVEITKEITEISIYESIYTPFMYGDLVIIDTSAMLSTFPFVGQEKLRLIWEREDKTVETEFYITDIADVSQINDSTGTYTLNFTSEKQVRNSFCLFSKSYKGNSVDIIKSIFKEYLREDIQTSTRGMLSHNVVFPYTKPISAINMVQQTTPAEDGTPMFVYETLYGNRTYLSSMKAMLNQAPVMKIEPKNIINSDNGNMIVGGMKNYRNQINQMAIIKGYDTLSHISQGSFGAQTISVDIGKQMADITDFDFRKHAPPISKDWITTFFAFEDVPNSENIAGSNGVRVNGIRSTKLHVQHKNTLAYEDFPNLNDVEPNVFASMKSYMKRLNTTTLHVYMNSVTELEAGKTVDVVFPRFSPNLEGIDDIEDKVNSGKYLISAIRHYVKNRDYSMSLELVRDGMGETASFYGNNRVPNFGAPLRIKKSLLPELKKSLIDRIGDLF
jgi:hypothetical protein